MLLVHQFPTETDTDTSLKMPAVAWESHQKPVLLSTSWACEVPIVDTTSALQIKKVKSITKQQKPQRSSITSAAKS